MAVRISRKRLKDIISGEDTFTEEERKSDISFESIDAAIEELANRDPHVFQVKPYSQIYDKEKGWIPVYDNDYLKYTLSR